MKPILFIPGFPASELVGTASGEVVFPPRLAPLLLDLLVGGPRRAELLATLRGDGEPLRAGEPILEIPFLGPQAEALYDVLRRYEVQPSSQDARFQAVGWNWREGIDAPAVTAELQRVLATLGDGRTPVVAVVHSTGGLVLQRFLDRHPEARERIERVVAFGVPWAGNLRALHYLARGDGMFVLSRGEVRGIMRRAQAAYDLLPLPTTRGTAPLFFVRDRATSPLEHREWISPPDVAEVEAGLDRAARLEPRERSLPRRADGSAIELLNVVAWGMPTETAAHLEPGGALRFETTLEGDGTVALTSAAWATGDRVRTLYLPVGTHGGSRIPNRHNRVWDAMAVYELFDEVLQDQPLTAWVHAAPEGRESTRGPIRLRLVAQDPAGGPLPDAKAELTQGLRGAVSFGGFSRAEMRIDRRDLRPPRTRFVVRFSWRAGDGTTRRVERVVLMEV